jgi:hypothetical protein
MEPTTHVEIVINTPINQIDRLIAAVPSRILKEELQFDLEAILNSFFDREFDIFTREGEFMGMTEVMFIPTNPLEAMHVGDVYPMCTGLKKWIEKQLYIDEIEVFLTFEEPPRPEVELFEQTTQTRRVQALLERIARK